MQSCCVSGTPMTEADAVALAAKLKALADPVRLRLVSLIASSEADDVCACDLPVALGRSQPTVSHHLSILVEAGILNRQQRGKWAWFSLTDEIDRVAGAMMRPIEAEIA